MSIHRRLTTLACTAAVACAGAFAALPAQAGNVGWSVSIGAPGFAIAAGEPWGGWGYRPYRYGYAPYYRPWVSTYVPAPVVYVPPVHIYRPYAPVYRPYYPAPVHRPPVVYSPYYGP
jgi:hypothetical protein